MRTISLMALGLSLALAGCSGSGSDDNDGPPNGAMMDNNLIAPPVDNMTMDDDNILSPAPTPSPTTAPAPVSTPAPIAGPAADFGDPDQLKLDAESAGMTARVDRSAQPPTDAAPTPSPVPPVALPTPKPSPTPTPTLDDPGADGDGLD